MNLRSRWRPLASHGQRDIIRDAKWCQPEGFQAPGGAGGVAIVAGRGQMRRMASPCNRAVPGSSPGAGSLGHSGRRDFASRTSVGHGSHGRAGICPCFHRSCRRVPRPSPDTGIDHDTVRPDLSGGGELDGAAKAIRSACRLTPSTTARPGHRAPKSAVESTSPDMMMGPARPRHRGRSSRSPTNRSPHEPAGYAKPPPGSSARSPTAA